MGDVSKHKSHWVLRYERRLPHPPEKVWRALTESEHLQHWLPTDIVGERAAGATIELRFWSAQVEKYSIEDPSLPGVIRVWDPPSVFEWTWDADVLRWELEPTAEGTLLRFTTWLEQPDEIVPSVAAGYHVCLDELILLLDTGSAPPLVDVDGVVMEWQARYQDAVAAATA